MASFDRQFQIIKPDYGQLFRESRPVADPTLLNPTVSNSFIDGEFMQLDNAGKIIRGADAAKHAFPLIDDRGDAGIQGHRKPTIVLGPRGYRAKTIVYADALANAAFGTRLEGGSINVARLGGVARWGLVAFTSNRVLGIVLKSPTAAGGALEYLDVWS